MDNKDFELFLKIKEQLDRLNNIALTFHYSIEVDTSADFIIDIHKYITKKLMSQLGWGKITKERLEFLNNILKNKTLKVICRDLSIAPIYRNFVPLEYDNWETALDTILFKS